MSDAIELTTTTAHDKAIVPSHGHDAHGHDSDIETPERVDNVKFGMWLFLASEVVIFTILIATFLVFRVENEEAVHAVHEAAGLVLVSANTFLLLTSSWAMVMGLREIKRDNLQGLIKWISITAVLGIVFVIMQGVEYATLAEHGITIDNSQFGMRFYSATAIHGIHVILGVIWAIGVIIHARQGGYNARKHSGVELFGLYWHFVDVVWILLFTVIYLI